MAKGVKGKQKNLIKWIIVVLLILAVLFLAFKIFFTGRVVDSSQEFLGPAPIPSPATTTIYAGNIIISGTCTNITITNKSICTSKTCSQLGYTCGNIDNGCGGILNCGNCPSGKLCTNGQCVPCIAKGMPVNSASQCCSGSIRTVSFWGFHLNYCN